MINLEYTCIKKGNYIVAIEPNDNPPPVNPEIDSPNIDEPDFDHSSVEIDYPDYSTDYELCSELKFGANDQSVNLEIDSLDFESIVDEVKKDIASQNFLEKSQHYMDLLKVNRQEFDDYLFYEFDAEELIGTDDEELIFNMDVKVNEVKVFDRLFSLYCQDNAFVIPPINHHLREYVDRLEPDGRYFPKKQLDLFG